MNFFTADRPRRSGKVLCMLVICAMLAGCGQLGPLYLPGERVDNSTPEATIPTDESDPEEPGDDDKPDGL